MDQAKRAADVVMAMHMEELQEAQERATRAEAELATLRGEATRLQAELDAVHRAHRQGEENLLLERGRREAAEALLTRERETCATLNQRLEQAIAAGAARPAPQEPAEYRLDMTDRDPNGRTRIAKIVAVPARGGR